MNLATRKAIYQVVGVKNGVSFNIGGEQKFEDYARRLYEGTKETNEYDVVLFCWTKPTMTKGQIDPDLY